MVFLLLVAGGILTDSWDRQRQQEQVLGCRHWGTDTETALKGQPDIPRPSAGESVKGDSGQSARQKGQSVEPGTAAGDPGYGEVLRKAPDPHSRHNLTIQSSGGGWEVGYGHPPELVIK